MPNTVTTEWQGATLVFVDTAWRRSQYLRMVASFAPDGAPDRAIRDDACFVLTHLESVKNAKGWQPLDATATQEQFDAACKGLLSSGTLKEFHDLVRVLYDLVFPKAGPLDKPDEALTEDEAADPN